MIMADVFKILFLILGMLMCTVSYWLVFAALFPRGVAHTQQSIVSHPWRVLLRGALLGLPLTLLGMALAANGAGPLKLLGAICLMSVTLIALFGSTGLVRQVGLGLSGENGPRHDGALVLKGGAAIAIACVLPLVGWFMVIPLVLIAGFGAATPLLWNRRQGPIAGTPTGAAVQA